APSSPNVLTIRSLEYIEAASALGASDLRIIWRHILPNIGAPILVIGSSQFAAMVLLGSGLSFLGIGRPGAPSLLGPDARGGTRLPFQRVVARDVAWGHDLACGARGEPARRRAARSARSALWIDTPRALRYFILQPAECFRRVT